MAAAAASAASAKAPSQTSQHSILRREPTDGSKIGPSGESARNVILDIRNGHNKSASNSTQVTQDYITQEATCAGNRLPSFGTLPQRVVQRVPYFSYAGRARNVDLEADEHRKQDRLNQRRIQAASGSGDATNASWTRPEDDQVKQTTTKRAGRGFSNISNLFGSTSDQAAIQRSKQVSSLLSNQASQAMNRHNSINVGRPVQQTPLPVQASSQQQQQQQQQQQPHYQRYNSSPMRTPPMYGRSTMALPVASGGSQRRLVADRMSRDNQPNMGALRPNRPASATGNYLVGGTGSRAELAAARARARSTASLYNNARPTGHAPAWLEPQPAPIVDPYGANQAVYDDERYLYTTGAYFDEPNTDEYLFTEGGYSAAERQRSQAPYADRHPVPHSLYTSPVSPVSAGYRRQSAAPNKTTAYYNGASRFSVYESTRDGIRPKLAPASEQLRRILGSTKSLNKPRPVHLHPQWAYTRPFIHLLSSSSLSAADNQLGAIDAEDNDEDSGDDDDEDEDEDCDDEDLGELSDADEDASDDDDDDDDPDADDETRRLRRLRRRREKLRKRRRMRRRRKRRLIDDDGYDIGPKYLPLNRLQDAQAIRAVDFHPSGEVYAVGSNTRTLRICAYPAEHELGQFSGPQLVASSGGQQQVPSARVLFKFLQLHRGSIYCVSFNAQGNLLATGSNDQTVHLVRYNSTTHNPDGEEFRLTMHDGTVRDLCFVDDHTSGSALLLSAGGGDNKIYVTDCDTVTPFQSMAGHTQPVMALHHCGGAQFVSGSQDRTVRFWDLRTRQCTSIVSAPPASLQQTCRRQPGKQSSSSSLSHQQATGAFVTQRGHIGIGPGAPVCTVRVDPSGRLLASGHSDSTCMLYDVRGARIIQTFRPHDDELRTLSFSPKSYYLLSGGYDNRLVVTDLQGNLTQPLPSACVARASDKIVQARWHPTDFTFVATSADKSATLYALPSDD